MSDHACVKCGTAIERTFRGWIAPAMPGASRELCMDDGPHIPHPAFQQKPDEATQLRRDLEHASEVIAHRDQRILELEHELAALKPGDRV